MLACYIIELHIAVLKSFVLLFVSTAMSFDVFAEFESSNCATFQRDASATTGNSQTKFPQRHSWFPSATCITWLFQTAAPRWFSLSKIMLGTSWNVEFQSMFCGNGVPTEVRSANSRKEPRCYWCVWKMSETSTRRVNCFLTLVGITLVVNRLEKGVLCQLYVIL